MNTSGKFKDVLGYISEDERVALQRLVLNTSGAEGDALEIGSLNGLSALIICTALQSGKTLICIEQGQTETLAENLIKHGHAEQVAIQCCDFKNVVPKSGMRLSFLFIDHDHTAENNALAFEKFWPLVSNGGIAAFHDYGHPDFKGGTLAIQKIMDEYMLEPVCWEGSLIAFQKHE